jgi:hypothetical protein
MLIFAYLLLTDYQGATQITNSIASNGASLIKALQGRS